MTAERSPERQKSLAKDQTSSTSWEDVRERLAKPESPRTSWLATTQADGRPHLVPINAFWIDGALHMVVGEGTRKARDLASDDRCVIGMSSTKLPSIDIVVEGHAKPLTDERAVKRVAEILMENGWPLEVKGDKVYGPNAPTAGPPPYSIFRMVPTKVLGLPGMFGMEKFKPEDLPKPTRWDFDEGT
jgi:nitroimidazol reductase NimA-like FMN-containing flavoprotein (pyridoxamine 5'-phosphate oxidase superfamily)